MQHILINKLHQYLSDNNPDVLITLQQEKRVTAYLEDKVQGIVPLLSQLLSENKPAYIVEELCMDEMTGDLRPSRFNYISAVLSEEFEKDFYRLKDGGVLPYEIINMMEACNPVFESFGFTVENEDDLGLYCAVTGAVMEYLENKQ